MTHAAVMSGHDFAWLGNGFAGSGDPAYKARYVFIEVPMFYKKNHAGYHSRVQGIDQKTLVHGERSLLAEFLLQKGSLIPKHAHPYEQTGYLISGHMVFTVAGEQFDARPGDSWCILLNVEHSAEVLEDSVVVEVFSPVREDYLPEQQI